MTRPAIRNSALALLAGFALACGERIGGDEVPVWALRETLRIGGGDEGPGSFSWVKGIAAGADGRIYIYEHSTQDIRVFGPDGVYQKTIGRRGKGPGELANAEGIAFAPDGTLWLRDAANARISRFDADGTFLDAWTMAFCTSQGTWLPVVTAERFVEDDCVPSPEGTTYHVVGYRVDRSKIDTLATRAPCGDDALAEASTWITRRPNSVSYRAIPYAPRAVYAVTGTGAVWCAPNSAKYELMLVGPGRDTVRVVRTVPPLIITAAERDSIIASFEENGPTGLDYTRIPRVKPAIERLTIDDAGRLWVRRSNPTGGLAFDLIRPDGTVQATVALTGIETPAWSPFIVRGDNVYMVISGGDDIPQVGRFRIERAP